ncbi:hypothetical protein [Amycolatopsis sp. NPDC052450]|uniref:hypothetical protein n=1 Tax=Amycolatopsis sp. NPDC052450 TaxID=3363937 RepID=UPI0037C64827
MPSTVEEFLEALDDAGGELRIVSPTDDVRAAWRRVIHRVRQGKHVPEGWHLLHRGRDSGDLVIEMRPGEHPADKYRLPAGERVSVPTELTKLHPVVQALRDTPERLPASSANRSRALMVIQALAEEAGRRGLKVAPGTGDVLLNVEALELRYAVRVTEESTTRWNLRLVLQVHGPGEPTDTRWCDRSDWQVEEALGQVLDDIVRRAESTRRDIDERDRREAEKKVAARAKVVREHRAKVLRAQVAAWCEAEQIRQHCDQLVAAGMSEQDEWVTWARMRAAEIDPLTEPPGMPAEPSKEPPSQRPTPMRAARISLPEPKPWHPNQKWWSR